MKKKRFSRYDSRTVIIPPGRGKDEQALRKAWKILKKKTQGDREEENLGYQGRKSRSDKGKKKLQGRKSKKSKGKKNLSKNITQHSAPPVFFKNGKKVT